MFTISYVPSNMADTRDARGMDYRSSTSSLFFLGIQIRTHEILMQRAEIRINTESYEGVKKGLPGGGDE